MGLGGGELDHPAGACRELRRAPAHVQARLERGEVVAGPGRGGEDRLRVEMAGLGQGPERGRARAGAAEREHRPLDLVEGLGERRDVVVGDPAGDDRHVPVVEAHPLGGGGERRARRLVLGLRVGPVVDHRPEALGGERTEIGLGDLGRDREKWRELGDLHEREPPWRGFSRGDLPNWAKRRTGEGAAGDVRACRPGS